MNFSADVIIAGAGPAGSTAAYYLSRKGVRVLILEKEFFPRYKSCGGGLTYKTTRMLPYDISTVIEREVKKLTFSSKYKEEFTKSSDNVLITTVMRDRFDAFLLERAINEGTEIKYGVKVTSVINEGSYARVHSNRGDYTAKLMIGADGANSITARMEGLTMRNMYMGFAIEYELEVSPAIMDKHSGTIHLDWGTLPTGYAWIFPKKDHISVGVGCHQSLAPHLKKYYSKFIANKGIGPARVISVKGHPLPSGNMENIISSGSVLLAGDAAGLVDPLTGEGLYYAISSGRIAAECSFEYLNGNRHDLSGYPQAVNKELIPELTAAKSLLYYFNAYPSWVHNYIKEGKNGWNNFCQVLTGDLSYCSLPDKLGKYKSLWKPVSHVAQLIAYGKRKMFRM